MKKDFKRISVNDCVMKKKFMHIYHFQNMTQNQVKYECIYSRKFHEKLIHYIW